VEVTAERNPRQSDRRERVELTIRSRGPVIRAEAAADDRYAALDRALAKLEARLRRLGDRRKNRHSASPAERGAAARPGPGADGQPVSAGQGSGAAGGRRAGRVSGPEAAPDGPPDPQPPGADDVIPIQMEGDGPVVVREKFHAATPMSIDQALLEMELVGHDFYLFRDDACGHPSVVYRRHGYQYGLIRLIETSGADGARQPSGDRERQPSGRV
jgi:sigma 54 modulation/S30EA-like ribosomal protein